MMNNITFVQKTVILHPTQKDKFLVLIRNLEDKSRPGDFDLPGGSVNEGELHLEALEREVLEETGLTIVNAAPVIVNSNYDVTSKHYFLYIGYRATAVDIHVTINTQEHSNFLWITLEEFRKLAGEHILLKQIEACFC